ncbi:hypothetical protein BCR44DRAFT_61416 [Catenaria anguillulae PL171]|uniref:BRCT domain-containing protein n=1 Tax=Catenaria anguillulae PL171 TaxID=765915 RepID=A0A1Y2H6E5_9FUNG|nr:hypothetical protein BCR44DRAFT_61416 [Catenaria anguillulae PL171]
MYEAMIRALGGHVMANPTSSSSWVQGTTHLVISVPISCEKCMCAIASGAWLLRPSFVEASYRAGQWVSEREHTWAAVPRDGDVRRKEVVEAGERAGVERMDVGKSLDLIAGWERVFRTIHGTAGTSAGVVGGAFRGWRVVLVGAANTSSYRNLLVAGGAEVVSDGWDPDTDPDAVTHVLVQSNRLDPHMAANDIVRSKTYSATLIIQSLMGDQPPTPVLLRRMSSRSFGTGSGSSAASSSASGSVNNVGAVPQTASREQAGYARPQRQAARVQSIDAASTGSTAY